MEPLWEWRDKRALIASSKMRAAAVLARVATAGSIG
jgi:hypothetical protein